MRLFVACTAVLLARFCLNIQMEEDDVGATCGTNGTEFVQKCGRKTLWKETHEQSTDRWKDKIEMGL